MTSDGLRIGQVAERAGVSVSTLRAWERRHGAFEPDRTAGGHRVYRPEDVVRARTIRELVDAGWSVAAAAVQVGWRRGDAPQPPPASRQDTLATLHARLWASFDTYDQSAAHRVLDEALDRFSVVTVLDGLVAPALSRLGEDWSSDAGAITREHFASHLLRTRIARLLADPGPGARRTGIALSPEGEPHDIGPLMAAITLQDRGWGMRFFGANMPSGALTVGADLLDPDVILVGACLRRPAVRFVERYASGHDVCVVLGGEGFRPQDARRIPLAVHHAGPLSGLPTLVDAAVAIRRGIA